ncbi:MAG: phosphoribosylaminoimidazolesuccinocarboxamide synthase [Gammaproteobacteria bacterium]
MMDPLHESNLSSLALLHRGKVRDMYEVDADHLLIVATDRLSAFDVVLPTPIPDKGRVLTSLSRFWFQRLDAGVANHLTARDPLSLVATIQERDQLAGRSLVVRKLSPLPIEAIVRGYLVGSGWRDYTRTGIVCGHRLPAGLREAERLDQPIFTPSTKAAAGAHDENISLAQAAELIGRDLLERLQAVSLELYRQAADYALTRGLIIADTKFEFGLDRDGALVLIDEVFTPDSSRFWPADGYAPGRVPASFDKQYVRDYLESIGWNKRPPAPPLPPEVAAETAKKYREALHRLAPET